MGTFGKQPDDAEGTLERVLDRVSSFRVRPIRIALYVLFGWLVIHTLSDSYFIVDQTQRGAMTYMGRLDTSRGEGGVLQPGWYAKLPWVEKGFEIPVSVRTTVLDDVPVTVSDGGNGQQTMDLKMSITHHVSAPLKALFNVGRIGNQDIEKNWIPILRARTLQVFGKIAALDVAKERESLSKQILTVVQTEFEDKFGVFVDDVNIFEVDPGKIFKEQLEQAAQNRIAQINADAQRQRDLIEAQRKLIQAQGVANSGIEAQRGASESARVKAEIEAKQRILEAEGQKQSTILAAQGQASATRAEAEAKAFSVSTQAAAEATSKESIGRAEAAVIQAKGEAQGIAFKKRVEAAGGGDNLAKVLNAEAAKNWNGNIAVPTYQIGGGTGGAAPTTTPFILQLPPMGGTR